MRSLISLCLLVLLISCAEAKTSSGPNLSNGSAGSGGHVETADEIRTECLSYAFLFCNDFPDCACQAQEHCNAVKRPPTSESYKTKACQNLATDEYTSQTTLKCAANGGAPWPTQCQQGYPQD